MMKEKDNAKAFDGADDLEAAAANVAPGSPGSMERADDPAPAKNIVFVRRERVYRDGQEEQVPAEAPRTIRDGDRLFELPDSKTQQDGFYHPEAARLIRAFPGSYKAFTEKGA
ncbi:MAG: hypothetical protein KF831_06910 [Acidobacteria bacterium]|nr:hypothetical protein [Acidobacteriota bacterium]